MIMIMNPRQILIFKLMCLAFCVAMVSGCDPKNEPRWTHEQAKEWKPTATPEQTDVKAAAFTQLDVDSYFRKVKSEQDDLTANVLQPLARVVLNRKFIESPTYRGARLAKMINVFNAAFVKEYVKTPQSADFVKLKQDYYNTVFSACSADLRSNCANAALFSADGRHTLIMTMLARELDSELDRELKQTGSPDKCVRESESCRNLIEERYRRLAMGVFKSNRYQDNDFAFSYLKYARVFSAYLKFESAKTSAKSDNRSMSSSYLAEVHGKIFETVIAKFKPTNPNAPDYRQFVENFNPWGFSRKNADAFQYGTGVMFSLATQCCLYTDARRTSLAESVRTTIEETQKEKDAFGLSFRQMVADIKSEHDNRVFAKLGMAGIVRQIENSGSGFYDEYFYIVDRLYRGHLGTADIEMMLRNTNSERARVELPKRIEDYVKVNLVYMILETNRFMSKIYRSDIASDRIFEEAIKSSRDLTTRWLEHQTRIDLLDKLMNSYFKERLITSPEYTATYNMVRAINRNIHYTAVVPHMIVMNYFLTKMKGTIKIQTWWNETFEIVADTIVKSFFDGSGWTSTAWFRFGKDPEIVDRLNTLYSLEFLLSTESLNFFVAKDSSEGEVKGSERSKFFDAIFTQYFNDGVDKLRNSVEDFRRKTVGNPSYSILQDLCKYEIKGGTPPQVAINLSDIEAFTYSGLGDNGVNSLLKDFFTNGFTTTKDYLTQISRRRAFVVAMISVIEGDLLRTKQIEKAGDPHPDLKKAREMLANLDVVQGDFMRTFVGNHKTLFDCALRLRDVERRRAYRLYEEERNWLGEVFDKMVPLAAITDDKERAAKIEEINNDFFKSKGAKLDRLDDMTYRMSKFDLYMRMKNRIESDIFMQPTQNEIKGSDATSLRAYLKPRRVIVNVPVGIYREEIYEKGPNLSVKFLGTTEAHRDDFIRQGMSMLSAEPNTFIRWKGQMDLDKSQFDYLDTLLGFYFFPKAESAPELEVKAADLVDAYTRIIAMLALDPLDQENMRAFQWEGHYAKTYLQKILFEKDGMNRMPFFYKLMSDVMATASVQLESKEAVGAEALDFAKRLNSMQAFVFEPSNVVRETVQKVYGDRIHERLNKVAAVFEEVKRRSEAVRSDATELDRRIGFPVYLEGNTFYSWYQRGDKNILDTQKLADLRFLITDFTQRSGKLYGTQEKVKAP